MGSAAGTTRRCPSGSRLSSRSQRRNWRPSNIGTAGVADVGTRSDGSLAICKASAATFSASTLHTDNDAADRAAADELVGGDIDRHGRDPRDLVHRSLIADRVAFGRAIAESPGRWCRAATSGRAAAAPRAADFATARSSPAAPRRRLVSPLPRRPFHPLRPAATRRPARFAASRDAAEAPVPPFVRRSGPTRPPRRAQEAFADHRSATRRPGCRQTADRPCRAGTPARDRRPRRQPRCVCRRSARARYHRVRCSLRFAAEAVGIDGLDVEVEVGIGGLAHRARQ